MPDFQARRTLVKSPPELWTEVSDPQSLARHLGEFGEITITRIEAETTVAWEGERASGTVELEPAGWGTAVTLTAEPVATSVAEPTPEPEPEPAPVAAEPAPARRGWLASLFRRRPVAEAATPAAEPEPEPEPTTDPLLDALTSALDSLGAAHHRPFSRG